MNKAELVSKIAEKADISKAKAVAALDAFTSEVTAELKGGNNVTLVGFGTFSRVTRKARTGRNPQNGQSIKIATKHVAKFKPGKKLSDEVKGKGAKKAK
jgi:DNA-binding protein HU-beta